LFKFHIFYHIKGKRSKFIELTLIQRPISYSTHNPGLVQLTLSILYQLVNQSRIRFTHGALETPSRQLQHTGLSRADHDHHRHSKTVKAPAVRARDARCPSFLVPFCWH